MCLLKTHGEYKRIKNSHLLFYYKRFTVQWGNLRQIIDEIYRKKSVMRRAIVSTCMTFPGRVHFVTNLTKPYLGFEILIIKPRKPVLGRVKMPRDEMYKWSVYACFATKAVFNLSRQDNLKYQNARVQVPGCYLWPIYTQLGLSREICKVEELGVYRVCSYNAANTESVPDSDVDYDFEIDVGGVCKDADTTVLLLFLIIVTENAGIVCVVLFPFPEYRFIWH